MPNMAPDAIRRLLFDLPQLPVGNSATVAVGNKRRKEHLMLDVVMIAVGLGFFALSVGYAFACERL
jgi:hypothetical protein